MHDPLTVAWEIKNPFVRKDKHGYVPSLITIWHKDPESDSTDDSCGWFIRPRHMRQDVIDKVAKEFESEWDNTYASESSGHTYNCGWFNPEGENILSVQGIVLSMYLYAAKIVLNPDEKLSPGKMWNVAEDFIRKHQVMIMYFAENNRDSLRDTIVRKFERGCKEPYTQKQRSEMIRSCAQIVSTDIMRKTRKWYTHPRWHIHHWRFQFHPYQQLKRKFWDKCAGCGKRGFDGSAYGYGSSDEIYHERCFQSNAKQPTSATPANS